MHGQVIWYVQATTFPEIFKSVFKKGKKKKLEFKGTKNKNKIMGSFVDNNFEAWDATE